MFRPNHNLLTSNASLVSLLPTFEDMQHNNSASQIEEVQLQVGHQLRSVQSESRQEPENQAAEGLPPVHTVSILFKSGQRTDHLEN